MIQGLKILSGHYGVFHHVLHGMQDNPERNLNKNCGAMAWNDFVNRLDVEKIAEQLHQAGAAYYFITIMQCSRYMIAPNKTYDEIVGAKPGEACAIRDLPMELAKALDKYGIKLFLYFTGDGPCRDIEAGSRFGFCNCDTGDGHVSGHISLDFVKKWASVLEEYAVRYGDLVNGWWIDGCYRWVGYDDELLGLLYKAAKKGNPEAAVALNSGVFPEFRKNYVNEDFTCGESNRFEMIPKGPFTDGALNHILAPLGVAPDGNEWNGFGQPGCQHTAEYMIDYVKKVTGVGGAVTIDTALFADSSFDPAQLELLCTLKHAMKQNEK